MKKISCLIPALLVMMLSSCVSTKKIVYFQGSDSLFAQAQEIIQHYEMKLKPADQVLVKVTCSEPELLTIFAQDVMMGSSATNYSNLATTSSVNNAYSYTVSNEGYLTLPALDRIYVEGCTTDECATRIEEAIIAKKLVSDPEVTVRLLNARVAVVGAVKSPQVVNLTSERNTIIDVLSRCGDVDDTGLRRKVRLYREEEGQRVMYNLDLTSADIFTNPAYYVQQNDMIYVEPNKSKSVKSSAFYTFLGAGTSILSLISTLTTLIVLIAK